ncbi:SRPBCC family protein [Streptomyces sp. NBC_01304]|uniref:SRPBCC family protein n=1 Tax=Streptomyces sp. NBC_01304 TaxID=2903818 RepID=UPI002E151F28|nr:SRPBCC domain-containing protein [Streptomyces sp. NBC_01304]
MSENTHTTGFPYTVSRTMNAPVARAWQAYTTAAEWPAWFGAAEGSVEIDVRAGGAWKSTLLGPEGGEFPLTGTFLEVEEGRRIVLTMDVPGAPAEVMAITFEEDGDGVKVTIDQTNSTAEAREQAKEGSTMILAGLAAHIEA